MKVYTGYDEANGIRYYENFEVVDRLPQKTYNGEIIAKIEEITPDVYNYKASDDTDNYEYFRIHTKESKYGYLVAVPIPREKVEEYLEGEGADWFYNPDVMSDEAVTEWRREVGHPVYSLGDSNYPCDYNYGEFVESVAVAMLEKNLNVVDAIKEVYGISLKEK